MASSKRGTRERTEQDVSGYRKGNGGAVGQVNLKNKIEDETK